MTADLGPAATPRPIPTPEDRMRHARQPGPTFATYLDRHDRDQLDARAATAEQERDDLADDLRELRTHHTQLHTRLNATENDLRSQTRAVRELEAELEAERLKNAKLAGEIDNLTAWLRTARNARDAVIRRRPPALGSPADRAQDEPAELPAWVLELVRGLDRYEAEHPTLYRYMGVNQYEPWPCPAPLLELVPVEARRQAGIEG